jgi:uncharacterized protein YjbK
MRNLEQELKLQLTQREYNILQGVAKVEPVEQINYYFAPKHCNLSVMLRLRQKGNTFIACFKQRITHSNGVMVSDEKECEIDYNYAQTLIERGITVEEIATFFKVDVAEDFYCIGKLTTYRTKFVLDEWTLELDKNSYFDITDYELECESTQIESLMKLKSYLTYTYGIAIRPSITKFERFLLAMGKK